MSWFDLLTAHNNSVLKMEEMEVGEVGEGGLAPPIYNIEMLQNIHPVSIESMELVIGLNNLGY
jgi:hypothetical protein